MAPTDRYSQRGVSADKEDVHKAIKNLDKGLFPRAFCKILPDRVGGHEEYCNIMHADTAGTKTSLAYLYWRETGDLSVWKGIAQDAIVMNIDDMACVGCTGPILLSSTIGRNKSLIPGPVLEALITGTAEFVEEMRGWGIDIHLTGGETADVGDIVRTIDVGFTTFARMPRKDLIVNDIQPGQLIIGLSSSGQTSYEQTYNSGMGSNGLTSARHDLLHSDYGRDYPESFDPRMPKEVRYTGKYHLLDQVNVDGSSLPLGQLILSPTRTYLPFLHPLLREQRDAIGGIIHCTGGGQTKVLKYIEPMRIVKDDLFTPPPLFRFIRESTGTSWEEMYKVFNMGHRLELYVDEGAVESILQKAKDFELEAKVIGRVEKSARKELVLNPPEGDPLQYNG